MIENSIITQSLEQALWSYDERFMLVHFCLNILAGRWFAAFYWVTKQNRSGFQVYIILSTNSLTISLSRLPLHFFILALMVFRSYACLNRLLIYGCCPISVRLCQRLGMTLAGFGQKMQNQVHYLILLLTQCLRNVVFHPWALMGSRAASCATHSLNF